MQVWETIPRGRAPRLLVTTSLEAMATLREGRWGWETTLPPLHFIIFSIFLIQSITLNYQWKKLLFAIKTSTFRVDKK